MKTALILRHAKSGWDNMHQPDHERTLTERGRQDAPRMGELLLREQLTPDTIVSSTAQRARETAEAVAVTSQFAGEILYDDNLYLAPPQVYLDLLQAMPDEKQRVLLIGHNPGLEDLVSRLTGQPTTMPSAALAHVQWDLDSWQDLAQADTATLRDFWIPRELA